ncbi:unnamed protein product [Dicrocoelium dendriticum]|nr:unnamed protein product [Dicrocoelium dendriticum]
MCDGKRSLEGLPFLPGYTFQDPTLSNFHLSHTLGYKNGFQVPKPYPDVGIGGKPLYRNQLTEAELNELASFQPSLTYGRTVQAPPQKFVPAHVALDKMVLKFFGYFKETVTESPLEHYRVRYVHIFYFLEDDSMQITEPPVNNSGIPQGKLVRRHRIPKNDAGDPYNWRDLNLGTNLAVYGRVYRITNCDKFTRDFLESEGVEVNQPEPEPVDPYLEMRANREALSLSKTPSSYDKRRQYLEQDHKEIKEYFAPKDFRIGQSITILGRKFFLYDCDNFTKAWYYQNFGLTDLKPIDVSVKEPEPIKKELPPYNGFGSLEDSLASMKSFMPHPPRMDYAKAVDYATKCLRYEARLDSVRPEDAHRRFILSYHLSDDMISIYETPQRNSGFPGGTYLKRARIAKPGSSVESPVYYGPADFSLGSRIEVFGNRFIITDADAYVIKFLEANRNQFSDELIHCWRARITEKDEEDRAREATKQNRIKGGPVTLKRQDGDVLDLKNEVKTQLKKMAITDKSRIDEMFLRYDKDRLGFIDLENLKDMCRKMQLPPDEEVLNALLDECGTDGRMTLEQFRQFFEL